MRGGEHKVLVGREVLRRDDGADGLALLERQQVHDGRAARMTGCLGQLVDLQTIYLALRGEEQHEGVRGRDEQVLDVVVILQVHRLHALAAALLLTVRGNGQALDVAGLRDRDHHALLGDEVFDVQVLGGIGELRSAGGVELLLDLLQLLLDDVAHQLRVGEDAVVVRDLLAQLFQLGLDLLALQTGQAAQAHLQDGRGLLVGQAEALGQSCRRLLVGLRGADDADDLVDVVECNHIAFQDMGALLGLGQLVARATRR